MKTDVRLPKLAYRVLPILSVASMWLHSPTRVFAQEVPPTEDPLPPREVSDLNIEENPIYERLIEIINFLSIGVTIVVAISVAIAGFQYMMSKGDPTATSAAVRRIVQAGTALILYVFGWSILNWLVPGGVLN